jgi:hypothetical protein
MRPTLGPRPGPVPTRDALNETAMMCWDWAPPGGTRTAIYGLEVDPQPSCRLAGYGPRCAGRVDHPAHAVVSSGVVTGGMTNRTTGSTACPSGASEDLSPSQSCLGNASGTLAGMVLVRSMIPAGSGMFRRGRDRSPTRSRDRPHQGAGVLDRQGQTSSGRSSCDRAGLLQRFCSTHHHTDHRLGGQPHQRSNGPPTRRVTPGLAAPSGRELHGLGWFLGLGLVGLVLLFIGLTWDAGLHARKPGLGSSGEPVHPLQPRPPLAVRRHHRGGRWHGRATWIRLGVITDPRRSRRVRGLLVVGMTYITALSGVGLDRAANAESAAHETGAGHVHATDSCEPSPAERGDAARLLADTRRGTAQFVDLGAALAAGYAPHVHAVESVKHYFNAVYVTDGRMLDPARPEGLLYATRLAGRCSWRRSI